MRQQLKMRALPRNGIEIGDVEITDAEVTISPRDCERVARRDGGSSHAGDGLIRLAMPTTRVYGMAVLEIEYA